MLTILFNGLAAGAMLLVGWWLLGDEDTGREAAEAPTLKMPAPRRSARRAA